MTLLVDGAFGFQGEGRSVRTLGVYPPSRLADVIQFFRAISADENNRTIVIERG